MGQFRRTESPHKPRHVKCQAPSCYLAATWRSPDFPLEWCDEHAGPNDVALYWYVADESTRIPPPPKPPPLVAWHE